MFDIIKRRYWFFALSLIIIVPGLVALAVWGLPLAIDFTGGTLLDLQFPQTPRPVDLAAVREVYASHGISEVNAQNAGTDRILVRSHDLTQEQQQAILADLQARYGPPSLQSAVTVGPSVGREVAVRAAGAVGLAALGILAYITFAFRNVPNSLRYGVCAIVALFHDVLVVIGLSAIAGKLLGWQIDSLFLTALLTVVGFSVHDTIVVFDRVRENLQVHRRSDYETVVNHSVVQTLDRSINTQLTVLFALLALALFGGDTILHFVVTLLVGIASGTYSSIFNAAALLVVWEKQEWLTWFRPRAQAPA